MINPQAGQVPLPSRLHQWSCRLFENGKAFLPLGKGPAEAMMKQDVYLQSKGKNQHAGTR
jgi:hypothetical protein